MINNIVDGICLAINAEFGDDFKIYTERIEQGLDEPCFYVKRLNHGSNLFLHDRYTRTNQFAIQYFPSTDDAQSECADVSDRLFICLDVVDLGDGSIRVSQMESIIEDSVLTVTVNYNFFVDVHTDVSYMEDIDYTGGVKDGKEEN